MGLLDVDKKLDAKMAGLAEGDDEDAGFEGFEALRPDEDASPEEEYQNTMAQQKLLEILSSDEGLPKIANVLHQDRRGLMEVIPDLLEPILLKIKADVEAETGEPMSSAVFFGQGGLFEAGVDELFELAQTLGIPGSDDPDQYSGALINLAGVKAGKHVLNSNDKGSMEEAINLGQDLVAEGEGHPGDMESAAKKIKKRELSGSIEKGLLV
jgi:hypothetical protein